MDLLNLKYQPHIIKKQNENTQFLIDIDTGVLFSQSSFGILSFKDEYGNKWVYSDSVIRMEIDLAHFSTSNSETFFGIDNLSIIDDRKRILQMAKNHFLPFVDKENPAIDIQKWAVFLN